MKVSGSTGTWRRVLALSTLALVPVVAAVLARPRVEEALGAHVRDAAARWGLRVALRRTRLGLRPPLRFEGIRVDAPGAGRVTLDSAGLALRWRGRGLLGRLRVALSAAEARGPAGLAVEAGPTRWDLEARPAGGWRAVLLEPGGLWVQWHPVAGGRGVEAGLNRLSAGRLLAPSRDGALLADLGVLSGTLHVDAVDGSIRFEARIAGQGLRLAALSNGAPRTTFGEPTDLSLRCQGQWRPAEGVLAVSSWRMSLDAATLSGSLRLTGLTTDPELDLLLEAARVNFGEVFRASGLAPPLASGTPGGSGSADLGSASLSARFAGRLADAASFTVTQDLDFDPPSRMPQALERLRGAFEHPVWLPDGSRRTLQIAPDSPDFVALADVPPLFVRTLLLGEDAGFFAHRGIDLSELPAAVLTNWARGRAARGASTLTQQLAKNLFLSRDKLLARKLQELSLALLLEAVLDKPRILEIYLNVIEWGPGLHGLRPAARRYFQAEPRDLTPGQMAFLVALVPGPRKYQRSFAEGTPSPAFRRLVDDLLAKLRSVDALSEDEYQAALAEPLVVGPEVAPAATAVLP